MNKTITAALALALLSGTAGAECYDPRSQGSDECKQTGPGRAGIFGQVGNSTKIPDAPITIPQGATHDGIYVPPGMMMVPKVNRPPSPVHLMLPPPEPSIPTARNPSKPTEADTETATSSNTYQDSCQSSLECWSNKHSATASGACQNAIERMAKYSFEWTDGWLDSKFAKVAWVNQSAGTLTYTGDKIKFQNGFGAWSQYTYFCDFDPKGNVVLDVRLTQGRL